MKIKALIVDDERWARRRIAKLLKSEEDIDVVGESASGEDAVQQIEYLSPHLVFLDIQMPGMNGFEVIDAINADQMPLFIFATAYDKYALRAFDAHALDYLLKPFDEERFYESLQRARRQLNCPSEESAAAIRSLLDSVRKNSTYLKRLAIKSAGRIVFIRATEIDWIEATGNYVTLHVGRSTYLVRTTMNAFVERLDAAQFVRIHRSTAVNLDRVQEILPWFQGEQVLRLKDGTELNVGRSFRSQIIRLA
jgi:two-component system, LytTR family, response regulator